MNWEGSLSNPGPKIFSLALPLKRKESLLSNKINFSFIFVVQLRYIILFPFSSLKEIGGLNRNLVVDKGQNYRLFSCMWLHGNVIHLIVNVLAILLMGVRLEEDYGFCKNLFPYKTFVFRYTLVYEQILTIWTWNCSENRVVVCAFGPWCKHFILPSSSSNRRNNFGWRIRRPLWPVGILSFRNHHKLEFVRK